MLFKSKRPTLLLWVTLISILGSFTTNITIYIVSKDSLSESIANRELPIVSDNLYSEINRDLVRPILISSQMAENTFLVDWILAGETDLDALKRYLSEIKTKEKAIASFFISEKTRKYYYPDGVFKTISPDNSTDTWYFRAREISEPYGINVDPDEANKNTITVFVNYRILDQKGNFLGITGVGLSLNSIDSLIKLYESQYHRKIYFVDKDGFPALNGAKPNVKNISIREKEGIKGIANQILSGSTNPIRLVYELDQTNIQVNSRYISELKAYLVVEQSESEALQILNRTLGINLALSTFSTLFVLGITLVTVNRYQNQLENLASTDALTGLGNRLTVKAQFNQFVENSKKYNQPFSVILFDIDFFKRINDTHGHLIGDQVIVLVSNLAKIQTRNSDRIFRWGGEEFLVLLNNCRLKDGLAIAEKIRTAISTEILKLSGNLEISITVSLGVGEMRSEEDATNFLTRVDQALYLAKNNGRNRTESGNGLTL
jgi:diguanylate cyclase (GGDEF)-like protein